MLARPAQVPKNICGPNGSTQHLFEAHARCFQQLRIVRRALIQTEPILVRCESPGDNLRLSTFRLLPPEPLVVKQPKSTRVEGADTVMQSSAAPGLHLFGKYRTKSNRVLITKTSADLTQ
jgi:hypothetical protein